MSEDRPFLATFGSVARRGHKAPKSAVRVANKEYPCEVGCGDFIAVGDTYRDTSQMRMCLACFAKRYPEATS